MLEGNLDGYQKKKYLAKVIFTYILGYKVDTGHMEAVNLISSNKYSEKQIVSFGRSSYLDRIFVQRIELSLNPHPAIMTGLSSYHPATA
jgi:hypothetical protein